MQFIENGPDIPNALLQAQEEGHVVFFCGAGISYPAGLPGFESLVKQIYQLSKTELRGAEKEVFKQKQFDVTLDLLERRMPGSRLAVRRTLMEALRPKLRRKGAVDTQSALLCLARNREGALRLVTTNFDRLFHVAAKRAGQTFRSHEAPMLPVPKSSRWDGLVYLHGLLPSKLDETALNRLVVTSGDFGLAYLTERWAARFVSELFRNYVVCFVGYSINDPVLRYMMDALAADRMLGEVTPQAWALGDCEPGQEYPKTIEWQAKGVTPILYNVPTDTYDHSALHQTLHAWAETYRDGLQGKEAIVVNHALARPHESTKQDDFVGRMLWALSDKSGLPAKRFADFNPAPSLDWLLGPFSDKHFGHSDLTRFGVLPCGENDTKLSFSLIQRPASYDRAPQMLLAFGGITSSKWDDVMYQLARWLVRHLDDSRLVIWIAERGGQLDDRLLQLIEQELDRFALLEREGKTSELNEIRLHAPKAIPGPLMRTLWRLLLSGRVKLTGYDDGSYRWKKRLKQEGMTTTMRLKLRELLAPRVALKKPFRWGDDDSGSANEPTRIRQLVDWEIVAASSHVHSVLRDLVDESCWASALPELLDDIQILLRDALDLLCELDEANSHSDRSFWNLPSISPHRQNRGFRDWIILIELLRDAWLSISAKDSARAKSIAQDWFELPYSTFKRLALFAASKDGCISPRQWVNWLLADNARCLWAIDTKREMFRLLVLQGLHLAAAEQQRLEVAILVGPLRELCPDDLEDDRWQALVAQSVWLRLAKLKTSGLVLGEIAEARLAEISNAHPKWQLASNESDEFSHWMSGTGDPDYEGSRDVDIAPRKRPELVQWLTKPTLEERENTWREVCRTRFFHSWLALSDLAQGNEWPVSQWGEALQAWTKDEGMVLRSWKYAAPLMGNMPDAVLQQIVHVVTWWLKSASKSINCHEDIMLSLIYRVLMLPLDAGPSVRIIRDGNEIVDLVSSAIKHPIGYTTQALLNLWFKQNPNDSNLLPTELKPLFTMLCDAQIDRFRHGRVLLGSQLINFFRVDRIWTEQYLLPLSDWDNSSEAKAVWEGFLWSPRLYQPLLIAFKPQFLDSANHYANLGEHRQRFAAFLTYVALGSTDGYAIEEFRTAIGSLPQEGLEESAQALLQALEGAGDQRENYWKNHVEPFWQNIWPKSRDLVTAQIAESLALLAIAAGDMFPQAVNSVLAWLQPIKNLDYVVNLLYESELCIQYSKDALLLLNEIIVDQQWIPSEVGQCLDKITNAVPELVQDRNYLALQEIVRKRDI